MRPPGTVATAVVARRLGLNPEQLSRLHREWGIGTRVGQVIWWTDAEIRLVKQNLEYEPFHDPWYVGLYGSGFTEYRQVVNEWMYLNGVRQGELARRIGMARQKLNPHLVGRTRRLSRDLAGRLGAVTGYAPAYLYMLGRQWRPGVHRRSFPIRSARVLTPDEIRNWREANRVSIRGLAELLGTHPNTIHHWERGEYPPPPMLEFALVELARRLKWGGYVPPNISTLAVRRKKNVAAEPPAADED
jgi:plasmid maintenance system antidote protein VapI